MQPSFGGPQDEQTIRQRAAKLAEVATDPELHPDIQQSLQDIADGKFDAPPPPPPSAADPVGPAAGSAEVEQAAAPAAPADPIASRIAEVDGELGTVDPNSEQARRLLDTRQTLARQWDAEGSTRGLGGDTSEAPGPADEPTGRTGAQYSAGDSARRERALPQWLRTRFDAGKEFDRLNRPRYRYNELELVDAKGRKSRVDSYDPDARHIVSRGLTQLAEIKESTAISYLNQLT
jgi:hypothetical protein